MTRYSVTALACLGLLSLTACNDTHVAAANSRICADFKTAKAGGMAVPDDGAAALDDCVRRWAYSLAPSRDDAGAVAQAVVGACNGQLAKWNGQVVNQVGGDAGAASLTTGEPTTAIAEHNAFGRSRALLYVVQARAGGCAAPPATNGVPDGVS
jgi:hypothetical protein